TPISTISTISAGTVASRPMGTASASPRPALRSAAAFPRRTGAFLPLLLLLLLFCHFVLNLCHQSGPLQGHQARGPQLHFRGFLPHQLIDQVRAQLLELAIARAAEDAVEAALEAPGALHRPSFPVCLATIEAAYLIQ